ncbi:MAG TPA: PQQ-binding-like beta-propeller repeat protein [Gemmatirosa sp.]
MHDRRAAALVGALSLVATAHCGRAAGATAGSDAPTHVTAWTDDAHAADAALRRTMADSGAWALNGRDYTNQRWSPLGQITTTNVPRLQVAWVYKTGVPHVFEATPVVVDGTMFLSTPLDHVVALDARTGAKRWEWVPSLGKTVICCGAMNRGVAVYGGRVFIGLLDARVVALDAHTGHVLWDRKVADNSQGYSFSAAPTVVENRVLLGVSGGEYGIRGFVVALDTRTGEEAWRFHTVLGPEDGGWWGKFRAADAWGADFHRDLAQEHRDSARYANAWRTGGAPVWNNAAIDTALHYAIFSTGNTSPDVDGSVRPGDNLCANSIIAVDYRTGKRAWCAQAISHDVWDLDLASPVVLFDARDASGRVVPAVGEAGKAGWFFIVDRRTGTPIRRSEPFTGIGPTFPAPPLQGGVVQQIGAFGGSQWSPAAYSPQTGYVYILGIRQPFMYKRRHEERDPGAWYVGGRYYPSTAHPTGTVSAVDVNTGRIAWLVPTKKPMVGGALATAGGLVFTGTSDKQLLALDARTGAQLWTYTGRAGVNAPPMTYAIDGVQYVAVAAGGNLLANTPRGDEVVVFTLDGRGRMPSPTVTLADTLPRPSSGGSSGGKH